MNAIGFATPFASSATEVNYQLLDAIKSAGYDYVELGGNLIYNLSDDAFAELCAHLEKINLRCTKICALLPASVNVFSGDEAALDEYLERVFERFEVLGVEAVGFGSGAARRIPDDWTQEKGKAEFAAVLRRKFLPKLIEKNITLNIEPLKAGEANLVHTLPDAAEVLELAADEHFGVVADTLHMIAANEDPSEAAEKYLPIVKHFHISEPERVFPAEKYSDECRAFVEAFGAKGYSGSISFETKCSDLGDLKKALDTLKAML